MRGASKDQLRSFGTSFGTPFGERKLPGTNQYTLNAKPAYLETQTPGGFFFKDIDRVIASSPAMAKQLRAELNAAGLGGIRVTGSGFAARLFKKLGIPGYNQGVEGVPKPKRDPYLVFDQKATLQMSHMSGVLKEGQNLTREQTRARFLREVDKGVRSGLFRDLGIDPKTVISQFDDQLAKSGGDRFRLLSSLVEPAQGIGNQKTAGAATEIAVKDYLKGLKKLPRGLFGSGILERLPKNHGIPDNELKSYISNIEKGMRSQLKTQYGANLPESELHKMYARSERTALKKVKNEQTRSIIRKSNALARLGLGLAVPAVKGSKSGPTRKYLSSIFGNIQTKTREMINKGTLGQLFGPEFTRKLKGSFLTQDKIQIPRSVKDKIKPLMQSLNTKQSVAYGNALIAAKNLPDSERLRAHQAIEKALVSKKPAPNISALFADKKSGIVLSGSGVPKPQGMQVVGGNASDSRMVAVGRGEAILSKESTNAIKRGGTATVRGIGRMGKFGPIRVPGAADGLPGGQYSDGTERVYKTESGQFRDRATKKRLAEQEAKRLMRQDKQNAARRAKAAQAAETKARRSAGIGNDYKMSQKEWDANSKETQSKLRAQRNQNAKLDKQKAFELKEQQSKHQKELTKQKQELAQKEEKRHARQEKTKGMGGRIAGGVGAAAMIGVIGGSMMGGQIGEIANQLMMPVMMLSMMAPMLTNPIGLAAIAIGGLAVAGFMLHEQFKQNIKKAYELETALGASSSAIEPLAKAAGNVTASEIMDRRRSGAINPLQIEPGKRTFGQTYLESEAGQTLKNAVGDAINKVGRDASISKLVKIGRASCRERV
jgi:hypothetical protein